MYSGSSKLYWGEEEMSPNVLAAIDRMHAEGSLGINRLGGLPVEMLDKLVTCALGKEADEDELEELIKWLADAHTDAQQRMRLRTLDLVQDWQSELYSFKRLRDNRKKSESTAKAQRTVGNALHPETARATNIGGGKRTEAVGRVDEEEAQRRIWANRAMVLLQHAGLASLPGDLVKSRGGEGTV